MWKLVIICSVLDHFALETARGKSGDLSRLRVVTSLPYKPEPRVVGGQPAPIEKYPYAAQVSMYGIVTCGGTLVTQRHVLTAAHCGYQYGDLVNVNNILVRLGSEVPLAGGTVYFVREFVEHPSYNKPLIRDNDVALFVLERMVALRDSVAVAALAPYGYESAEGVTVFYIGWGYLGNGLPQAKSLQEVPVKVVAWETCQRRYDELTAATGKDYPVTTNMFCAGLIDVGGQDACGGDSGGPVVEGGVVVGVISWGLLCAEKTYPGVNTKVSRYYDWIDQTVEKTPGMLTASDGVAALRTTLGYTIVLVSIAFLM